MIERLNQVCHITAPHRLRGPRDLEALPREDIFKPVQRKIVRVLAGYDIGQQPGTGKPLVSSGTDVPYAKGHAFGAAVERR
jgi:hypothetical protein